ncbi:MAG TPA: tRNA (adenosine(37)-N6)-dimethylallyltransferase MiaA [Granulicella sp.]|nr:tRNA (adenosine(37)-N6)-dimethylallyltransferase MiaA [Granulicella sp.]
MVETALLDTTETMASGELPMVVLVGATASGKTALSLALAEEFGGEIVSCDSVAVYREMEIGTAKPSLEERGRVPHHMIDVVAPDQAYTAGEYSRGAREALAGITGRGRLPIVAGGTGLYLRALVDGLFPAPAVDPELRARLRSRAEEKGAVYLHRILCRLDARAAGVIHANDVPKVVRAIEVSLAAREPLSEQWEKGRDALSGYRILRLGLDPPRALLYERINQRAAAMFERGLVEETERLVERYGYGCTPLGSLGYAQAVAVLRGEMTREAAIAAAQQGHRNYAKRQGTWFRREPEVHWLAGTGGDAEVLARAKALVREHLAAGRSGGFGVPLLPPD